MTERAKYKRRIFIINKKFQFQMIGYVIMTMLIVVASLYFSNRILFDRMRTESIALGLNNQPNYFEFLLSMQDLMERMFRSITLLAVGLVTFATIFLSHKIAGPLYKLRKHMDAVAAGETEEDVWFRKGDFFMELADSYNQQLHFLLNKRGSTASVQSVQPATASAMVEKKNVP